MQAIEELVIAAAAALDFAGVLAILLGVLAATVNVARRWRTRHGLYRKYRQDLGRVILLGLELLVAADIVRTVAVRPTLDDVLVLGLIVLIRTFLSIALQVELEGRWPWQERREPHNAS